ncbi:uncharacterized protein LOC141910135 [Tubulanus polymorphus]|uniref:uncharacterized protein LOC141910135 n=1 Tax=Tubulanus polymorphus TaxID=672921 RepID=UPI003DA52EF0
MSYVMYRKLLLLTLSAAYLLVCCATVVAGDYENPIADEDSQLSECDLKNYVCRTLMRISRDETDSETSEDQENCKCEMCSSIWDESDGYSLTWTSYERRDQQFQYKFCSNITNTRQCQNETIAAQLITDVKRWNPRMDAVFCRCPRDEYWLDGWRRDNGVWSYIYTCYKPTCERRSPCVKHYFDYDGKTTAFEFECSCDNGFHCPTNQKLGDAFFTDIDSDEKFMYGYCERNNNRKYVEV